VAGSEVVGSAPRFFEGLGLVFAFWEVTVVLSVAPAAAGSSPGSWVGIGRDVAGTS